jgi:hypothetical protein
VITEAAALLLRRYDPKASHFELAANVQIP